MSFDTDGGDLTERLIHAARGAVTEAPAVACKMGGGEPDGEREGEDATLGYRSGLLQRLNDPLEVLLIPSSLALNFASCVFLVELLTAAATSLPLRRSTSGRTPA